MAMEVKAGLPKLEEALGMLEFQQIPKKISGLNRTTQTEGAPTQQTVNSTSGHNRATQTEVALVPQRVNSTVVISPSQARSAERNSGNKRVPSSPAEQRMQGKKKREGSTAEEASNDWQMRKSRRKARKANRAKREGEDAGATPTATGRGKQVSTRKTSIKVGWISCRVRRRIMVTHCYVCLGYGHRQAEWRGIDRRKLGICIQCGLQEHLRKDCLSEPKCFLCTESGLQAEALKHVRGSGACKMFSQAIEKARIQQSK